MQPMTPRRILLIQGHPDPAGGHLCHALAQAYADGAREAGHELRLVDVAQLDFPLLRSQKEWHEGALPPALAPAQQDILWAQHLEFFFPLWMGDMPALLKGFLEQVARPGFAFKREGRGPMDAKGLTGRSGRVVVTYSDRPSGVGIGECSLPDPLMLEPRFSGSVHFPSTRREVQMSSAPKPPDLVDVQKASFPSAEKNRQ